MGTSAFMYVTLSFACAWGLGALYINCWTRFYGSALVPTGYGIVLPLFCSFTALLAGFPAYFQYVTSCLLFATFIYWFDDLFELTPLVRIVLSITSGAVIFAILTFSLWGSNSLVLIIGSAFFFGVCLFIMTTLVNFYDGADLNVSVLIGLMTGLTLAFGLNNSTPVYFLALVTFGVLLGFVFFNRKPKVLFLGDSGCFAFAGVILISFLESLKGSGQIPAYMFLPLTLPLIDVIFVICLRLKRGENLMTRNYLHLYQIMQRRAPPFAYLLPQIINVFIGLAALKMLTLFGFFQIHFIAGAIFLTSLITYFVMRYVVSHREERVEL